MRKLTVIGSLKDRTTAYVARGLIGRGIDFDYLDVARIIASGEWRTAGDGLVVTAAGVEIHLARGNAAYYRYVPLDRSGMNAVDARKFRAFTADLHLVLRNGALVATTIPGNAFHNFSKALHQIIVAEFARGMGVKFPDSILSNSPARLLAFAQHCGFDVIAKGASGSKTWALGLDEIAFRERLQYQNACPTFLQRRVRGWDCRVHTVAGQSFGEAIYSDHADYRRKKRVRFEQVEIPRYVSEFCTFVSSRCGALLSGVDFKVDDVGTWYFLELNSMPCFQGYDRRAKGQILDALISVLLAREEVTAIK